MRPHRPTPEFPVHLEALYAGFPFDRSFADDPISAIRPLAWDARRAEIAGMFASTLAIGNTTAIRGAIARLAASFDGDLGRLTDPAMGRPPPPAAGARSGTAGSAATSSIFWPAVSPSTTHRAIPWRTRSWRGSKRAGFAGGVDALARVLRGAGARSGRGRVPVGYTALFPSPLDRSRSPSKRLTLFVRWMVRERYPDLGVWRRVPTGELRIPLDQHVHWIAYHLGLTARRTRSWQAVEEVSEALRRIDPIDPIRYDFVLCHTGISGDCPKERDISVCGPCSVRLDCLLWRRRGAAS